MNAESLRTVSSKDALFVRLALHPRPCGAPEASAVCIRNAAKIRAAKFKNFAVFFGVSLASATAFLIHISPVVRGAIYALALMHGLDFDFFFGDEVAHVVQSGADIPHASPADAMFDTNASVVTIQSDTSGADAPVDEETGFKAEPIETSPLYEHYDKMSCEQLKTIVTEIHMAQHSVSPDMIEDNDFDTEEIERHLAVIDNIRIGKLLGGDTTCNF